MTVGPALWRTELQYPGRQPLGLTFFLVSDYTGAITNRAFASLRWAPMEALADFNLLEGDAEFVAQVEKGLVQFRPGLNHAPIDGKSAAAIK